MQFIAVTSCDRVFSSTDATLQSIMLFKRQFVLIFVIKFNVFNIYTYVCVSLRRTRWAGHVARMVEILRKFCSKNLKKRNHSEDVGVDEKIILKWILREIEWEGVEWMNLAQERDQ
jgi:hypothetical protein